MANSEPRHPLAGKMGDGPPLAPVNWRWRAGQRLKDMYFYTPEGTVVRSKKFLVHLLETIKDPPRLEDFCWRVTKEVLEQHEAFFEACADSGKIKRRKKSCGVTPEREEKREGVTASDFTASGNQQPKTDSNLKHDGHRQQQEASSQMPIPGKDFLRVAPLAIRAPGSILPKKVSTPNFAYPGPRPTSARKKVKARREKPGARSLNTPRAFRHILAHKSSFEWLYDPETLSSFLEDARRLKDLSSQELEDLRELLRLRNSDMSDTTKYPNSVLRVFVRLLREDAAPDSMEKAELAELFLKLCRR